MELIEVLTGFKWIGQQILKNEMSGHGTYLFGMEESYGCLIGTYAVIRTPSPPQPHSARLPLTTRSRARPFGMPCWICMRNTATTRIAVKSHRPSGIEGLAKIQSIMENLRGNTPAEVGGYKVLSARDYKLDTIKDMATGEVKPTGLPASNVLYYDMNDGAWLCVRPSGTEPKIKFYYGVKGTSLADADEKSAALGDAVDGAGGCDDVTQRRMVNILAGRRRVDSPAG